MRVRIVLGLMAALSMASLSILSHGSEAPPTDARQDGLKISEGFDLPSNEGSLAVNLTSSKHGLWAVWLEPMTGAPETIRLQVSRFDGKGWHPPATVTSSDQMFANWADVPSIRASKNGTLFVHWAQKSSPEPYAYDVMLARSDDQGITWKVLGALNRDRTASEHGFVSLVPDTAPTHIRAIWLDGRETVKEGPMTLRSARIGETFGTSQVLDPRTCDCCSTTATLGPTGPIVAYRDRSEGTEVRDISVVRMKSDGIWTQPHKVTPDGWQVPGCPVNGPALSAEGSLVALAWYTAAASRPTVKIAFSEDGGASFGPPTIVDSDLDQMPLGRVDVAVVEGGAIVSWLKRGDEALASVQAAWVSKDGKMAAAQVLAETEASRPAGVPVITRRGEYLWFAWRALSPTERVVTRRIALASFSRRPVPKVTQVAAPVSTELVLSAVDLTGKAVSTGELRGKPAFIQLWATWCRPCRAEIPEMAKLAREFGDRIRIIGVNLDDARSAETVHKFVQEMAIPYEVWLDPKNQSRTALGVAAIPFSVLLNVEGKVIWRHAGLLSADNPELRKQLNNLVGER